MKPLDRLGDAERAVIDERTTSGYSTTEPRRFTGALATTLQALVDRLLPGVSLGIDLVAFVDRNTGEPLGRGDRRAGLPPEPELFAAGLIALAERGFSAWPEAEQRELVSRMRRGEADKELDVPAKDFVDRVLDKALAGYLAHPDTWIRIGFTGPAYPEGYAWIGPAQAVARHAKRPGWDRL